MKNSGFVEGVVDPCLYMKKSSKGLVYIALYVDDNLMIGNMVAIDHAIASLKAKSWCSKLWKGCKTICPAKYKFLMIRKGPGYDSFIS